MQHDASQSSGQSEFLTVAQRLGMLSEAQVQQLSDEESAQRQPPSQIALQHGWLSVVEVDVVDTLTRPTDTIPGYEILELLGRGGMGVVYRAKQQNLDRDVALKTILISQMSQDNAVARFEQEAVTVGKLHHPHIINAYDFGRHGARVFFAMELVEGEDLAKFIDRKLQLDEATAWGITRQAAAGLAHAAAQGVVHRDIKPANLLLVEAPAGALIPQGLPMVKIADFGLALLARGDDDQTRLTSANVTVGSPHYMPPEQYHGHEVDLRSDIYSLGATIYHMLAGKSPYHDQSVTEVVVSKLKGTPPEPIRAIAKISPRTADLIEQMMQLDAAARPQDYGQLLNLIDETLSGLAPHTASSGPVPATPPPALRDTSATTPTAGPSERTTVVRSKPRSHRWKLGVAAGLGLAGILALAALLWPDPYRPGPRSLQMGETHPLYDGRSMGGWPATPISGLWGTAPDEHGSVALAGTSGMHRRPFGDLGWEHYQISALVWLQETAAAEVHFGISAASGARDRYVVRIEQDSIQLGRRGSDRGPLDEIASRTIETPRDDYAAISIERQPTDWFVFLQGEFAGAVPHGDSPELPELRIAADGGTVWFHQIEISQLLPRTP